MITKPNDCICDGDHTDAAGPEVSTATLQVIQTMEPCPAERRALARLIASRF